MAFYSIIFGVKLCQMAPLTSLEFVAIQIPSFDWSRLLKHVALASKLCITLSNGYLFHPTNHQGHIVNKPLTSSSTEAHLKYYLKGARIHEGGALPLLSLCLDHSSLM